jgi:hypothetical protein
MQSSDQPDDVEYWANYDGTYYRYDLNIDCYAKFIIFEGVKIADDGTNPNEYSNSQSSGGGAWFKSYGSTDGETFMYYYDGARRKTLSINGTNFDLRKRDSLFLVNRYTKEYTQIATDLSSVSTDSISSVEAYIASNEYVLNFFQG